MKNYKIGVIGLGYVGLPLAVAFAEKYQTIGFDINKIRIAELKNGQDSTLEISSDYLKGVLINGSDFESIDEKGFIPTFSVDNLSQCNVFIITVPTPTDKNNRPDLTPLIKASETIGKVLKKGNIVVYESTVYPGVTEDVCVPILEKESGLHFNKEFFVGYSPERINPGDKEHTVKKIKKVTSGSTIESAIEIDTLYNTIITAGTHLATSIKVAEAAKVIENSQRDINIAFMNELSKIFNLMGIDTLQVLEAAGTKWNFLPFKPGLVGGHCISVDPYYLAQKAQEIGYHPEIILSGRRINDSMGKYVALEIIKLMIRKNISISKSKVLILGFTFKENCPDTRNSRVIDIYRELLNFDLFVDIYDPLIHQVDVYNEYGINTLIQQPDLSKYSAIIIAVAHKQFNEIKLTTSSRMVVYDIKGVLPVECSDGRL